MSRKWDYCAGRNAPCCISYEPWPPGDKFNWAAFPKEDAEETIKAGVKLLQRIAPKGIVQHMMQALRGSAAVRTSVTCRGAGGRGRVRPA